MTFTEKLKKEASLRKKIRHVYKLEDKANRLDKKSTIHLTPSDMRTYLEIRAMWDPKTFKSMLKNDDFKGLVFSTHSFKLVCDITDKDTTYLSVDE